MKLATKQNEFHTNGVLEHQGYRVANSVHLMEILSGLYKDPLKATIRELSTNAADAHSEVGKDKVPFEIKLPDHNDPICMIRDFGPGLSKEKMLEMYTVYGVSDKSNSNDFDGCLGLGSKSPFTYTDSFTTTSYHKGTKYVAVNAINERGRPTFNIMVEEPTSEPDGLEVSFEVAADDVYNFKNKAVDVYKWFTVPPKTIDGTKYDVQDALLLDIERYHEKRMKSAVFNGEGWSLYCDNTYSYDTIGSYVIMGNVAYPLEADQFEGAVAQLISMGVHLNVERGDVDFAPSRDMLKYTEHTKSVVKEKIETIIAFVKEKVENEIQDCEYVWDVRLKAREVMSGPHSRLYNIVAPTVKYNGEEVDTSYSLNGHSGIDTSKFVQFHNNRYSRGISQKDGQAIHVDPTTRFVISDLKNKGYAPLRRYINENNHQGYFYLFNRDLGDKDTAIDFITEELGVNPDDILLTSTFPVANGASSGPKTKKPDNIMQCRPLQRSSWGYASVNYWGVRQVDINQGTYYYVEIDDKYKVITPNGKMDPNGLYHFCNQHDIEFDQVIGLTERRIKKIKDKSNWIKLEDFIKKELDNWHSVPDNLKSLEYASGKDMYDRYKSLYKHLKKSTELFKFLNKFQNTHTTTPAKDVDNMVSFYKQFTGVAYKRPKGADIDTDFIDEKYPMLQYVDDYKIQATYSYRQVKDKDAKVFAEYVNSIG